MLHGVFVSPNRMKAALCALRKVRGKEAKKLHGISQKLRATKFKLDASEFKLGLTSFLRYRE